MKERYTIQHDCMVLQTIKIDDPKIITPANTL